MSARHVRRLPGLLLLVAGAAQADTHVDAHDYPAPGQGAAAFAQMERALVRGFDGICGDTFCEGEYSNLRALQLRCAVRRRDGVVVRCLWSFAGSWASVDPATGEPQVQASTYACTLPLANGTDLSALLDAVGTGADALERPLPGTRLTAYHALVECL